MGMKLFTRLGDMMQKVRNSTLLDIRAIWDIRNQIDNLFYTNYRWVNLSEFESDYLQKYHNRIDNALYVLCDHENTIIGYCRMDRMLRKEPGLTDEYNVLICFICIDSLLHGNGYGKILLSESITQYQEKVGIPITFYANIHEENIRSKSIFIRNGFLSINLAIGNYH